MDLPEEAVSWPSGSSLRTHAGHLMLDAYPCRLAGAGRPRLSVQW
jgi:hypothetical protein